MTTAAVTPNVDDDPFAKFAGGSQAQPTAAPTSDSDDPFAKFATGTQETQPSQPSGFVPNARIRNMTVDPTKNFHSASDALLDGMKTGAEYAAIPASAIGLGEAAPIIAHLSESLPTLDKAYRVLKAVGGVASGAGGTLYTLQHLKDVLKIIGGSGK